MAQNESSEKLLRRIKELESQIHECNRVKNQLEIVFDFTPDVIGLGNLHGAFTRINASFRRTFGYSEKELRNTPFLSLVHEDDVQQTQKAFAEAVKRTKDISIENRYKCKDGTYKWIEWKVLSKPGENQFIAVGRDLSKRKAAEELIQQSEEKYRTILESMDEGYYELDLSGRITFVNNAYCTMLGYTKDELLGMNYWKEKFKKSFPEAGDNMFRIFNDVFRTGKSANVDKYEVIRKDGSIGIHELSISLIKEKEGNPIGFRGLIRNVAERIRAEEEKRKIEAQLHQIQKMEAIGTLAGGIAHDFNNLLMSIQGKVSVMVYNLDSNHPLYDQMRSIEQLIQSGSHVTRQLLGFAREGKFEVTVVNLNHLVKNSAKLFASTKKELMLHTDLQRNIWAVEVDPNQIDQVLLNVFLNASQAMPTGGHIYIKTENIMLDELFVKKYVVAPGKFVKISIMDTGIGMDAETVKRIFEPFFTTKEMNRGTGLGLASAYGIIKNHKGIINAYSEKDMGTTFNIYLPASGKKFSEDAKKEEPVKKGTGTILLVDDEERIIEAASDMLKLLGFTVVAAKNGKEAIKIYTQGRHTIDLVILDMILPEMNGSEIYDRLKAINPEVKVLLSSGYSANGLAADIIDKGCNGFIQKPFTLEKLSQKVSEIVEG